MGTDSKAASVRKPDIALVMGVPMDGRTDAGQVWKRATGKALVSPPGAAARVNGWHSAGPECRPGSSRGL